MKSHEKNRSAKPATSAPDWMEAALARIGKVKVAVFGDFCLDAYWIIEPGESEISVETGLPVRMVVRIKEVDEKRGFVRYFWKATLDRAAIAGGMTTMLDDGVAKCRAGLTSAAEVLRVTTVR